MVKVSLEFLSWLSETMEFEQSGNSLCFELYIEEGYTVKDLLLHIAAGHPRFEQSVFDVKLQKLSEKVCIFHNSRQLELENGLETRLKDGDSMIFVPVIQGGQTILFNLGIYLLSGLELKMPLSTLFPAD